MPVFRHVHVHHDADTTERPARSNRVYLRSQAVHWELGRTSKVNFSGLHREARYLLDAAVGQHHAEMGLGVQCCVLQVHALSLGHKDCADQACTDTHHCDTSVRCAYFKVHDSTQFPLYKGARLPIWLKNCAHFQGA